MPARIQPSTSNDAFSFHARSCFGSAGYGKKLSANRSLVPHKVAYKVVLWNIPGASCVSRLATDFWVLSLHVTAPGGHANN
jgi:hypothetical protein